MSSNGPTLGESLIAEFFVGLGFNIDYRSLRRLRPAMEEVGQAASRVSTILKEMAFVTAAAVSRVVGNLEGLYFAAQRTHSSAASLMAFERAAQNFGASADEARDSVEGLAHALRENPGNAGLLASWGIQLTDVNGKARDMVAVMMEVGAHLNSLPIFNAMQWSQSLGISEHTMLAMRNGTFQAEYAKRRAQTGGAPAATAAAHRLGEELRDLSMTLEMFGLKVWTAIEKKLGEPLKRLNGWLKQNGPGLADKVANGFSELLGIIEKLEPKFLWLLDKFLDLDKRTGGWSTEILGLVAAINLLGGAGLITGVLGLTGAVVRLGGALATLAVPGVVTALSDMLGGLAVTAGMLVSTLTGIGAAAAAGGAAGWALNKWILPDSWKKGIGDFGAWIGSFFNSNLFAGLNTDPNSPGNKAYVENRIGHASVNGQTMLLSSEITDAIYEAFKTMPGNGTAELLRQRADFLAGSDMEEKTRQLILASKNSADMERIIRNAFSVKGMPVMLDPKSYGNLKPDVTVNHTTDIHVHGSGDPDRAGRAAAKAVNGINRDSIRSAGAH